MKAAKTWCLAGLILVAGLSSASCGKDEGNGGTGGHGSVIGGTGGSGGGGGMVGRSGSTTGDAGEGDGGPTAATKLGRACVSDKDCTDAAAPGLTCVTSKDAVLGQGAPPKGLCTAPCTMPQAMDDVDACAALGPDAFCFSFSNDTEGYCVEGCQFGPPDIGETKCHNRADFACYPALVGPATGSKCTATDDCPAGDLCVNGECNLVTAGCLPSCRGDLDCEPGTYCDQSFLAGTCVAKKPTGKALGEPCTLPTATEPQEPDECVGYCQADVGSTTKGHCAVTCGLFRQCGWNSATGKYDGLCAYGTILTQDAATADTGDFGFCTPTCNCTTECVDPDLACSLEQGALNSDFRGPGLCFSADSIGSEYNQCSGAGGDGSGGAGIGGAPNGGDGSGGVPAGGAGAAGG